MQYIYEKTRWRALFGAVDALGSLRRRPRRGAPDLSRADSILVMKPDQVGDLILSLPLLRALRERAPSARLELAVGEGRAPVLDGLGVVDAVHELPMRLRQGTTRSDLPALRIALRALRERRPEITVVAKEEPLTVFAASRIGSPVRVGFREGGLGFLLTHYEPIAEGDGRHQWEILASLAGPGPEVGPPVYPLDEALREGARGLETEVRGESTLPLIVIHPGAGLPDRRWPVRSFAGVAKLLSQEVPALFVWVSGPGDPPLTSLPDALPRSSRSVQVKRILPLHELAALLERATLFLGNDSAPGHLAAAVGTPAVVVSLSGNDPARWGPAGSRHRVVVGSGESLPPPEAMSQAAREVLRSDPSLSSTT